MKQPTKPRAFPRRIRRERQTIGAMIRMYCEANHLEAGGNAAADSTGLCEECSDLLEYSLRRVEGCSFGERKPVCSRCTVHCFRPTMRDRVRVVMRYAGPRMIYRHPYLAVTHMLNRRQAPREG
jgi:hypothetical protein